jgi:hypothetical protein
MYNILYTTLDPHLMTSNQHNLYLLKELHEEALANVGRFKGTVAELAWQVTANFLDLKVINLEADMAAVERLRNK